MDPVVPDDQWLRYGDLVLLRDREGSYMTSETSTPHGEVFVPQSEPGIAKRGPVPLDDIRPALYRVMYVGQYTAAKRFDKLHDRLGEDEDQATTVDERVLSVLKREMDRETASNTAEQKRMIGRRVTYGSTVLLCHVASSMFVAIRTSTLATLEKDCFAVEMCDKASKRAAFQLMPRYKVRSEGEPIRLGDMIIMLGKRRSMLHVSTQSFDDGRKEVNASSNMTEWRLFIYRPSAVPKDTYIEGATILRLFHKEIEGFLSLETTGEHDKVVLRYSEHTANPAASTSSNTLFMVERESHLEGGPIKNEQLIRLRHVATGMYLATGETTTIIDEPHPANAQDEDEEREEDALPQAPPASTLEVVLVKSRDAPGTRWMPRLVTETSVVPQDGHVRLFNVDMKRWLHVSDETWKIAEPTDLADTAVMVGTTRLDVRLHKVACSAVMLDQDAFQLVSIEGEELHDLGFILGTKRRVLNVQADYLAAVKGDKNLAEDVYPALQVSLKAMIMFCTESDDTNPLTREGIPLRRRQKLFREQKVIDLVVALLKTPFEEGGMTLDQIKEPENKGLQSTLQLCYRLLKQVVKEYAHNGEYLGRWTDFMQNQLGFRLKTADTLMEMFSGNHALLESVTEKQMLYFVDLLTKAQLARYVNFLQALTVAEDTPVARNQDFICRSILVDHPQVLLSMKLKGAVPMIDVGGGKWMSVAEFCDSFENRELVSFFERQIALCARLCQGRNYLSMESVRAVVPPDVALAALSREELPNNLRATFAQLILTAYLDAEPQEYRPAVRYTRVYDVASLSQLPIHSEPEAKLDIEKLKAFLLQYISANSIQIVEDKDANQLMLNVLKLAAAVFEFGLVAVDEVNKFTAPLLALLDGRTDRMSPVDEAEEKKKKKMAEAEAELKLKEEAEAAALAAKSTKRSAVAPAPAEPEPEAAVAPPIADEERFQHTEYTNVVMECKAVVCGILGLLSDRQLDRRLNLVIDRLRKSRQGGDADLKELEDELDKSLGAIDATTGELVPILLDLTLYKLEPLARAGLRNLVRYHSQKEELVRATGRIQLLMTDTSVQALSEIERSVEAINTFLASYRRPDGSGPVDGLETKTARIIQRLAQLCDVDVKDPNEAAQAAVAQTMMRNLEVHLLAIKILHMTFSEGVRAVFIACYDFLRAFCRDHSQNQRELVAHVPFFLTQMGIKLKAAGTIMEVYRNNRAVCSSMEESMITHFVRLIVSRGRFPRYLRFLETVVVVDGLPLRRNQDLVLRALFERDVFSVAMMTFRDAKGKEERRRLVAEKDHMKEPEGLLNYYCELIRLLSMCAEGANHAAEVKCQSILTGSDCLDVLMERGLPICIRGPIAFFLVEVYMVTERKRSDVFPDPTVWWDVLDLFLDELKAFAAGDTHDEAIWGTEAQQRSYIFHDALPFCTLFFNRQYRAKGILPEQEALCGKLTDAFVGVLKASQTKDELAVARNALDAAAARGYNPANEEEASTLMSKRLPAKAKSVVLPESQVARKVGAFSKLMTESFDTSGEMDRLVDQLSLDQNRQYLQTMVLQVARFAATEPSMCVAALNTLCSLVERDPAKWQLTLDDLGATEQVIVLIGTNPEKGPVVEASLKLLIALLEGGTRQVQDTIAAVWRGRGNTGEDFFFAVRQLIRWSLADIKERKQHDKKVMEAAENKKARQQAAEQASDGKEPPAALLPVDEEDEETGVTPSVVEINAAEPQMDGDDDDDIAPFEERGFPDLLLRALQLCCEGHNLEMQNLMRRQPQLQKPVNLLSEVLQYLGGIVRQLGPTTLDTADQLFDTLTEFLQGPCRPNQALLVQSGLVENANKVLANPLRECDQEEVHHLKADVIKTLLALMEGQTDDVVARRIIAAIDFSSIRENLDDMYNEIERRGGPAAVEAELSGMAPPVPGLAGGFALPMPMEMPGLDMNMLGLGFLNQEKGDEKEIPLGELYETGVVYFMLIKSLMLFDDGTSSQSIADTLEGFKGREWFESRVSTVEVARGGELERLYFPLPSTSQFLTEAVKDKVKWSIDRSTPNDKIQSFFELWPEVEDGMRVAEETSHHPLLATMFRAMAGMQNLCLWLAFVVNILVALTYTGDSKLRDTSPTSWDGFLGSISGATSQYPVVPWIVRALGIIVFVLSLLFTVIYLKTTGPVLVKNRWRNVAPENRPTGFMYVMKTFIALESDTLTVYYELYVMFSLAGVLLHPFFFSFHLLDVVTRFTLLQYTIRAVTSNGRSLLLTSLLGVIIIWIFSVIGAVFFRTQFGEDGDTCHTMWACFTTSTMFGLGMWEDILGSVAYSDSLFWPRLLYDSLFFIIIVVVLMNIIFGIIIDSFGALRDEKAELENDVENRCLICGLDRAVFDREGNGFTEHVHQDHYQWAYLFLRIHLRDKDPTEYNGQESYVAEMLAKDAPDLSFFPQHRALVLTKSTDVNEFEELGSKVESVGKQVAQLAEAVVTQQKSQT